MSLSELPFASAPDALDRRALLFGRDPTPGIVSVSADRRGRARVWRRVDGQVICEEDGYPNWLLLARRELLEGLLTIDLPLSAIETLPTLTPDTAGVIELQGDNPLRYLVLTQQLEQVEAHVATAIRRGQDAGDLTESISELMYVRPPVEQYLMITGRTYFKGMAYTDIRRLQFDFETTGLGAGQDRIFMVAVRDSDGFSEMLDTGRMSEADLLRRLVEIIRERDPDVIENHNIFDFDIRFLMKRAEALEVPLPLGRDGSTFWESRDSVKIGATNQSFTRYSLTGREIIDTLHATRRFAAIQRDLRSSGLKEAAKYFGVAASDREYVDGAEIWRVFQSDPDRIRRYCFDDVEEVDRLSPLLLASSFALASMVPKAYERIATAGTGQGLIEPLLVRAYIASGQSLPIGRSSGTFAGGTTALFTTGIVHNVVKADVASLYPSIMLAERIGPAADRAGVFLELLEELTQLRLEHKREARTGDARERGYHDAMQAAMKVLINSFYGSLGADFALFCDKAAASRVAARGREILQLLLDELERRGVVLVEADTDGVLFSLPPHPEGREWTREDELELVEDVARAMPAGIQVEHDGRYRTMYSYHEKNYALLEYDADAEEGFQRREPVRVVGVAFRSAKTEPYIQQFLVAVLGRILRGDYVGVRKLYRETCRQLREHTLPAQDVCVSMPLTKNPQTYAKAKRREEPYEVYLAAGHTGWKPGLRIQYYQAKGAKKLLTPGANDYDADFYINRLRTTCKARLEKAFAPEDLEAMFSEADGLFETPLGEIQPLRVTARAPLTAEPAEEAEGEEVAEVPVAGG